MTSTNINTPNSQLYAAVDLGSNSFHLVVVKVAEGNVQIIGKVKQKVSLAAGLDEDNKLDADSLSRGWKCLESFAERLQDIPPHNVRVVATATLRLATNAVEFLAKGQDILQNRIEVISGEEEARQIYLGVAYTSANQGNSLVIDIGGASTEVIVGNDMQPIHLTSINMGCVTFIERYFSDKKLTASNFEKAISAAKELLEPHADTFRAFTWKQCLGASGTPQAITEILVTQGISDAIKLDYMHELKEQCITCKNLDDLKIKGLTEPRRAIFPSGLSILIALFEMLDIEEMQISGGALREGLIYGMLENKHDNDIRNQSLDSAVSRFHIELPQALRVRHVAVNLLQQASKHYSFKGIDADAIIKAATLLHEIGLHIEYKLHHKHGAYILDHMQLNGFTQIQQNCIRDLVLSHRQSIEIDVFSRYPKEHQHAMHVLCRIIRLANVLCVRRKDNLLPDIELKISPENWCLVFPEGWLKSHPLIDVELANEKWLQHKVGWQLDFY
ncbi:guanosine-5'-triphosphate,3'-diphosphate pyrophosphatase [Alteromonadaceae bacterium M269]|nr:guanosine-5'-triphosphate,3'-diphosphate pyrophosphatase [Alteromonadaceae bacterium M269]